MTALPPPSGRQPEKITVTPSSPNPWHSWHRLDRRFSLEQYTELQKLDLDPDEVEVVTVRRTASGREMWWPVDSLTPYFEFECPIIGTRRDGRFEVISPAGFRKLVPAHGWITKHPRIKQRSWSW